jgi:hypothetical protein
MEDSRSGSEQTLGSIGQGFAEAVDSAMIGRDQSIPLCKTRGHTQARYPGRGCDSTHDQFAA